MSNTGPGTRLKVIKSAFSIIIGYDFNFTKVCNTELSSSRRLNDISSHKNIGKNIYNITIEY